MRLNICVKGLITLLLVLFSSLNAAAQEVRVVPIVPSTPSGLITAQTPGGGVPTPSGQVPSQAAYPALNNLPAQVQQQMQQLQGQQTSTPQLPQTTLPPLPQPAAQTTQPPGEANIPQQAGSSPAVHRAALLFRGVHPLRYARSFEVRHQPVRL